MRQTLIIALSLFLGCATGVAVRDVVLPARAQGPAGPGYEYAVYEVPSANPAGLEVQGVLNRIASRGWRHSSSIWREGASRLQLVFERPRSGGPSPNED